MVGPHVVDQVARHPGENEFIRTKEPKKRKIDRHTYLKVIPQTAQVFVATIPPPPPSPPAPPPAAAADDAPAPPVAAAPAPEPTAVARPKARPDDWVKVRHE